MNRHPYPMNVWSWLAVLSLALAPMLVSADPDTSFTYQGRLTQAGSPANGLYDMQFALYNALSGGLQVGSTLTKTGIAVSNGLFTVPLDFGAAPFDGSPRWLQITVKAAGAATSYTTLSPRQPLSAAPYALYAKASPWSGLSGVPAGFADGIDNDKTYQAGVGLDLTGTTFSTKFAGSGAAPMVARSDHDHWGARWLGTEHGLILDSSVTQADNSEVLTVYNHGGHGTAITGNIAPPHVSSSLLIPAGVAGFSNVPAGGWGNMTCGVYGNANGANSYGVLAYSSNVGVYGNGTSTNGIGVSGEASVSSGTGVMGKGKLIGVSGTGDTYGVKGNSTTSSFGYGVYGEGLTGTKGYSTSSVGNGVIGEANASNGYGIWGKSISGYAGFFSGKVNIVGQLSKSSGSFKIDHPLDPANKYLYHSFVESPDMKNIYDGVVVLDSTGQATVTMPDWFEALNKDFRYQLTCIGGYAPVYIAEELTSGKFRIAGGRSGLKVSWQVTGIRKDPWANDHRIQVEEPKPADEVGTYLYPQGYGQPEARGMEQVRAGSMKKAEAAAAAASKVARPQSEEERLKKQGMMIIRK